MPPANLTTTERMVLEYITNAWNAFQSLPIQHYSDVDEFRAAIHRLSDLVGIRVARRLEPELWATK